MPIWLVPVALAVLAVLFYSPCFGFEFTSWDDDPLLTANPLTAPFAWSKILQLWRPGAVPQEQLYIPLTYLTHLLENAIAGVSPAVTHGVNVLLHGINAALVFVFAFRLRRRAVAAAATAVLFILHPLQVEAVAWAMGRKDLLATLFALAALLSWLQWQETRRLRFYALAATAFGLGMLAKPSVVVLPGLFLLLALRRDHNLDRRRWFEVVPLLVPAAIILGINLTLPRAVVEMPPLGIRLAVVPWLAEGWLLRLLLVRRPLAFYPWPEASVLRLLATGLPLTLLYVGGMVVAIRRGWRFVWFGLAFFAIAFLPAAGLVIDYRKFITADRYGYFPLIGLFFLAGVLFDRWLSRCRRPAVIVGGLVFVILGARSRPQIDEWRHSTALWSAVAARGKPNKHVLMSLGEAHEAAGRYPEAIAAYRRSVALDPDFAVGWRDLGGALLRHGQFDEAITASTRALNDPDQRPKALQNLGAAYFARQDYAEALAVFEQQLEIDPDNAVLHLNLAKAAAMLPAASRDRVIAGCRRAVELDPGLEEAYFVLAGQLLLQGKPQAAEAAIRELQRQNPDSTFLKRFRVIQEQLRSSSPGSGSGSGSGGEGRP